MNEESPIANPLFFLKHSTNSPSLSTVTEYEVCNMLKLLPTKHFVYTGCQDQMERTPTALSQINKPKNHSTKVKEEKHCRYKQEINCD
jgi:hypothetical protein